MSEIFVWVILAVFLGLMGVLAYKGGG